MKNKVYLIVLFLLLLYQPLNTFAEDYTTWGLPEGAKARLGKGVMTDITCTQDGALLAVASTIGIWIYDLQIGEELALLPEPTRLANSNVYVQHSEQTGDINYMSFSPDGRILASASRDNTVSLWDMNTWSEIGTLEGHTAAVKRVLFSPDGTMLVSGNRTIQYYPNPFNPETWIPYQLANPAYGSISIYAADGKVVRTLKLGNMPAGRYQNRSRAAHWDGKNAVGEPVASGLYFYTLTAGDFTETRKMLIRK